MALFDQISSELTCSVCKDIYDVPKSLQCGHTFCDRCINPLIECFRSDDYILRMITCPLCRELVIVPRKGFSINFVLNNIIDNLVSDNKITVINSNMSDAMESAVKRIVWQSRNEDDISLTITEKLNEIYGKRWNCYSSSLGLHIWIKEHFAEMMLNSKFFLEMQLADKKVYIFKWALEKPCWKCGQHFCNGSKCNLREVKIVERPNQMQNEEMIEQAKRITLKAVIEQNDINKITNDISDEMHTKYGGNWICMIEKSELVWVCSSFRWFDRHFMLLNIGQLYVTILKTE